MLQVTVRNLERKCYRYSQNIYILFSLGVIPLDRHYVNQASFGNQFQTSIQEKSKRYHKKKLKKNSPRMPRMTSWNWLNIKDSRQFSLQHGRQRGITPANIVLQGTIVCMDPNIFSLWDMITLYKLNLIFFRFRKHKCLAIDSSS